MLKRRLMALLFALVFAFCLPSGMSAATDEQDASAEFDENDVFAEPIGVEDLPFEIASAEHEANDISEPYATEDVTAPLNIELDQSGKITSISPKFQPDLEYEVYILQDGEVLISYNSALANSEAEADNWESIALNEDVKYFISIVVTNEDTIDSYDGYFSILDSTIVYDYLFFNSADIAALNGTALTRAIQYESESNDAYGAANTLGEGNNMYGNISNPSDRDWYRVQFSRDGNAAFSLTNIPSGTDYNMGIYVADNTYSYPSCITVCRNSGSINENYKMPVDSEKVYYIEVSSVRGYNGSLNYCVKAVNTPITDQYEINDTTSKATTISLGNIYNATIHNTGDVDYYKLANYPGGVLIINLTNIPSGTNYDLELYNSSNTKVAYSLNSGTADETITYSASAGTYYIKVFSASGANSQSSYKLTTASRPNSVNLTCTVNPKIPENAGKSIGTTTPIKDLPIKIYTVTSTGSTSIVADGKTNSAGVFTKSSISIGSNVASLRATVTFEDSNLSIRKNNQTVYAFDYNIPLGNSAYISVSLPNVTTIPNDQVLAYGAWKNGKECIANHASISSTSLGQLVLRSEVNDTGATYCSSTGFIHLSGDSSKRDYLDIDIIQHEMGHWVMNKLNAVPSNVNGDHGYGGYFTNAVAYNEGWANFYSCAARNSSQLMNYYSSSNSNYGADLSNATYYSKSSWKQMPLHKEDYSKNQTNELNVGTVFWAYKGLKNYNTVQSILSPTKSSMKEVYNAAIQNAAASEKKAVWDAFNNRGCAFDMSLPTADLDIYGTTARVTASDNIAIEKIEWYVNGTLVKTVPNKTSDSLSLYSYSGNINVEARVYDPEGVAASPRPREQRYTSVAESVYLSSPKSIAAENELTNFAEVIPNNSNELLNAKTTLSVGECTNYTFHTDGYEDISIFAHIIGGIEKITLFSPDGTVYDTIAYISPDAPYIIKNAQPGDWKIEFSALSQDSVSKALAAAGIQIFDSNQSHTDEQPCIDDFKEAFATPMALSIVSRPAKVACSGTIYTNNPFILLEELSSEKYVFVYSNGQQLDYSQALPDGDYELEIVRKMDGLCSDSAYMYVTVDTVAPQISFGNEFDTYEEGIYLHGICSKDTVEVCLNGEYVYMSDVPDFGIYLELAPGENKMSFELYDRCGNKTTQEIVLQRHTD